MLNVDDGHDTFQSLGQEGATFPSLGTHSTILAGRQKDNISNPFNRFNESHFSLRFNFHTSPLWEPANSYTGLSIQENSSFATFDQFWKPHC